jgi:hypothetical protein
MTTRRWHQCPTTLPTPDQDHGGALSAVEPFDYSELEPGAADTVREATAAIREHHRRGVEAVIGIGRALEAVRATLEHGQWLRWLKSEFDGSQATAYNYISAAGVAAALIDETGEVTTVGRIGFAGLLELGQGNVPEEVRAEAIRCASAGETITRTTIKTLKAGRTPGNGQNAAKHEQPPSVAPTRRDAATTPEVAVPSNDDRPRNSDWSLMVDAVFDFAERAVAVPPAEVAAYFDPEREPDPDEYSREEWREQRRQKIGALRAWLDAVELTLIERGRDEGMS